MRFLNFHLFIAAASAIASVSVTVCLSVRVNQKEFCSSFAGRYHLPPVYIGIWVLDRVCQEWSQLNARKVCGSFDWVACKRIVKQNVFITYSCCLCESIWVGGLGPPLFWLVEGSVGGNLWQRLTAGRHFSLKVLIVATPLVPCPLFTPSGSAGRHLLRGFVFMVLLATLLKLQFYCGNFICGVLQHRISLWPNSPHWSIGYRVGFTQISSVADS